MKQNQGRPLTGPGRRRQYLVRFPVTTSLCDVSHSSSGATSYLVDVEPKNVGSKMAATGLMSSFTTWLSAVVSSSPSTFVLESTAGFHRGVRLELEPGDVRIGSTPGADIVLRDAGIAAEHAVLRVGRRSIDLHAIGGEVRVGEEIIANGYGCALQAPIDLTIGEARLRISIERNQAPAPTPVEPGDAPARPRISAAIMIAGALLLAVPALGLAAMRPAAKADDLTSVARAEAPGNETLTLPAASKLMADLPAADRKFIEHCLSTRPGISVREAIAELNGCATDRRHRTPDPRSTLKTPRASSPSILMRRASPVFGLTRGLDRSSSLAAS